MTTPRDVKWGVTEATRARRELAGRLAPELLADGFLAVAATGSTGRGDADDGSDLDLWVVAPDGTPRTSARDEVEGVPVTFLVEPRALVLDEAHLAAVEVPFTWILADPHGVLAEAMRVYARIEPEVLRDNAAAALARVDDLLRAAPESTPEGRLFAAREAAHLLCARRVYLDTRLMMPKMRHFRALLPDEVWRVLADVQGFERQAEQVAWLASEAEPVTSEMAAHRSRIAGEPIAPEPPREALKKIEQGAEDDGLLALRVHCQRCYVNALAERYPGLRMAPFLRGEAPPRVLAYWEALFDYGGAPEELAARAERALAAAQRLRDPLV